MRITTCFRSAMVPLQPLGSTLAAAEVRAVLAAAGPPTPTAAAALPSAVYCRKRRRLTPGTTGWPGCHTDPVAPWACSRGLSVLVMRLRPLGAGGRVSGTAPIHVVTSRHLTQWPSVRGAGRFAVNAPCQSPDGIAAHRRR